MTEGPPSPSRPRRLLVVDDSRLILTMVRDFFEPQGYVVEEAGHGGEALERIRAFAPDVIVADVLMPVMDGWELFEEVRKRPETAEVPFLFLTVEGELPKRLRGFHLGADDYVTKPFAVEELHARVERILSRREQVESARQGSDALLGGSVSHLAISDLLQILALNGKDGIVRLVQAGVEGAIVFERGDIVHASCGPARGRKALFRMFGWSEATFRVLPLEERPIERTVEGPATNLLMDGLVSLDEWNRWKRTLPPLDTVLRLSPDARARLTGGTLPSKASLAVLARAKTGATVQEVLDGSQVEDAALAEAICTLLGDGILRGGE